MTEFEQQVAEALRTLRFPTNGGTGLVDAPMDDEHIGALATRVAAAIEAPLRAVIRKAMGPLDVLGSDATLIGPVAVSYRDAALAALRGER